jgi:hypothetical protein
MAAADPGESNFRGLKVNRNLLESFSVVDKGELSCY